MNKINLSEKQKAIVYADNIAIYVKASAGSGKTRVLTERIRHLLSQTNKKILALTFTNKAGQEIKQRLENIADIHKHVVIGTFHSFCQSILENHGHLINLAKMPHIFENEADRLELVAEAIQQTALSYAEKTEKKQANFRYSALNFIAKVKRQLIFDIEQYTDDENITLLYKEYQDILNAQNAIDFDDLLLLAYKLFIDYPKVAALYRQSFFAICIDEAQDLNHAQYEFLRVLAGNEFSNIMMVGDANQSIFHFTGSSPDYMDKEFIQDFDPKIFELKENYRSSKAVLKATKAYIKETEDIPRIVKQGIFELRALEDEEIEAQWIVNKIKELLILKTHEDIEGDITYEKIAVLARNKYVFKSLENQLQQNNIAFYYKMTPGTIRFESDVMKIFDFALRVRLNPQDELHKKHLFKSLNIKEFKYNNLQELCSQISNELHQNIINMIIKFNNDGSNLKHLLEEFRKNLIISDEKEKEYLYKDIEELIKHWYQYTKTTSNKSLQQFKNVMALGQTHALTQYNGITLSTIHTMKGQEFDIVFIIGMDDETFPDYRAIRNEGIELKQERNNLYVAFTRAKRFLYITWPQKRKMPWGEYKNRKISRFLKE